MAKDDDALVPQQANLATVPPHSDSGLDEAFEKMSQLLQMAMVCLQLQNDREADVTARAAEALYNESQRNAPPVDLLLLEILKNLVILFVPLIRAMVFQTEGRYARALEELAKGIAASNKGIATIEKYEGLPDADQGVVQAFKPTFSIFPVLFRGADAAIRAEMIGYKGNISHYTELLREAVVEYRKAEQLPPSQDQVFLALVNMCVSVAGRLETRIEVFQSEPPRLPSPTGEKIFIVHGHAEGKWRELRDLLEDHLNLKTIELADEPGAGETIINKFEEAAKDCCYAFALITPDDFIEKEGKSYFQARPNVLFELGWFYGRFGRDRVCIVKQGKTEMPSDLAGILTINFQTNVSEGLLNIERELGRVGITGGARGKKAVRRGTPPKRARR